MFSVLTSKIFGGVSIALLLALVVCWLGWTHAAGQRDDQISRNGELNLKLATSNQSIETLQGALAAKNAESLARAAALAASEKQRAADDLRLAQEQKASQTQIYRLNALARSTRPVGDCTVPKELDDALDGL